MTLNFSIYIYIIQLFLFSGSHNGIIKLWKCEGEFKSLSPFLQIQTIGFINALAFTKDVNYLIAAVAKEHKPGSWMSLKDN